MKKSLAILIGVAALIGVLAFTSRGSSSYSDRELTTWRTVLVDNGVDHELPGILTASDEDVTELIDQSCVVIREAKSMEDLGRTVRLGAAEAGLTEHAYVTMLAVNGAIGCPDEQARLSG